MTRRRNIDMLSRLDSLGCGLLPAVTTGTILLVGASWALEAWFLQWVAGEAFSYDMSYKGALGITFLLWALLKGMHQVGGSK